MFAPPSDSNLPCATPPTQRADHPPSTSAIVPHDKPTLGASSVGTPIKPTPQLNNSGHIPPIGAHPPKDGHAPNQAPPPNLVPAPVFKPVVKFNPQDLKRDQPPLAKGSYGIVYTGRAPGFEKKVVIKDMQIMSQKSVDEWKKEVKVMA